MPHLPPHHPGCDCLDGHVIPFIEIDYHDLTLACPCQPALEHVPPYDALVVRHRLLIA